MTTPTRGRLNAQEAAEYVGLSASTMRAYRSAGTGPKSYKIGRRVFYDVTDLDRWIEDTAVRATNELTLHLECDRRVASFFDLGGYVARAGVDVSSGPHGAIGSDRGVWFTHTDAEGIHVFVAANYKRASAAKAKADAVQAALEAAGFEDVVRINDNTVQVKDEGVFK
ncbi:helix-turn-helix domain-containing protein [Mycolicibacterium sp. 018/SC-01/001]|uniref:helix-turn-helix transcriptional regulator n=1 Tax=Mycolicibacterium sp. 018/SC-01/001 TaxID=2592069 RepID=UPI00117FEEF3|nr:helix-turn-helix domain-containing protein [Mycolicibacterium sp. 018/SC-01/001]TRW77569.1 helix-turn-helix domain-containing protein [Mycolicibacterium sp. 018/SC-01/001]